MTQRADILVIGGGIAGVSAAARLAPDANVIVLEQEETIGYQSTGRWAAIFIGNYGNPVMRAINAASEPELEEPAGFSDTSLLSSRGVLMVASEEEIPDLEAFIEGGRGIERQAAEHQRQGR